ncbi:MAG: NAD(P)/FAD-dependent oxidoreductase [Dehalococcoidia bacterium]|nr:NAD(P)/FAD-dependent oxidoreductase [Dehalococcoidia bacterium]
MSRQAVVVVGAGAAGMMAAGRAAELGAEVFLLEKMEREGKKILISGNARCNLTNARSMDDFIPMYGENGRFLYTAFRQFFSDGLIGLLGKYGVRTSTAEDGRIFPASGKSADVVQALTAYMKQNGVAVTKNAAVLEIEQKDGRVTAVYTPDRTFRTETVVMATGGASYPRTGSNGEGYRLAERLGHTVIQLRPALVPLAVKEMDIVKSLQGISLKNVRVTAFACKAESIDAELAPGRDTGRGIQGKSPRPPVIESRTGDLVFTHYGVSGPAVLLMSLAVADALAKSPVSLSIDLLPGHNRKQAQDDLQQEFSRHGARHVRTAIGALAPLHVTDFALKAAGCPPDKMAGQVSAKEREKIINCLKDVRFNVNRTRPLSEAMVTAGGVDLNEVDPRTMESKLVKGLYFCGELLDIDADTGGYNLQAAFSTGYLAGQSAARLC